MINNDTRVFAKGISVSNDTRITGLNNNDMIIGSSGAGKTGGYVLPNIMQYNTSFAIADTKGNLFRKLHEQLKHHGYTVYLVDFVNPECSDCYNPLDYVNFDEKTGRYREKDIMTIASALCPDGNISDSPFWTSSARNVITCLVAFVLEAFEEKETHNLASVMQVFRLLGEQAAEQAAKSKSGFTSSIPFLEEWSLFQPESTAAKYYQNFRPCLPAEKTWGCIMQFVNNALSAYDFHEAKNLFHTGKSFRIEELGRRKTAVFLNISDTDRALDHVVNLFYTQALQQLCAEADKEKNNRLKIPVRLILDDFATNTKIPNFDGIISVIRSREISVSIILQSLTQLTALYGTARASTILNNCDHVLYLGGTDLETVRYISKRVRHSMETVMEMPLNRVYYMERGKKGVLADKLVPYACVTVSTEETIDQQFDKRTEQIMDVSDL